MLLTYWLVEMQRETAVVLHSRFYRSEHSYSELRSVDFQNDTGQIFKIKNYVRTASKQQEQHRDVVSAQRFLFFHQEFHKDFVSLRDTVPNAEDGTIRIIPNYSSSKTRCRTKKYPCYKTNSLCTSKRHRSTFTISEYPSNSFNIYTKGLHEYVKERNSIENNEST